MKEDQLNANVCQMSSFPLSGHTIIATIEMYDVIEERRLTWERADWGL